MHMPNPSHSASDRTKRIGWFSISAITLVVLVGFILVRSIATLSADMQRVQVLASQSKEVWYQVVQHVSYVLGRPEGYPLSDAVSRRAQDEVRSLLSEQQQIQRQITDVFDTLRLRDHFLSEQERKTITASQVDADVMQKIREFVDATPAVLRAGFSSWSAATHMKIRTGFGFRRLNEREAVLASVSERVVSAMSDIIVATGFAVLLGIWLIWFRVLLPNIGDLRMALRRVVEQNEILEETRLQLTESQRDFQLLFDNLPGAVATISRDYTYLSANKAYLEMLALKDEAAIIGRRVEDVVGPASWKNIESNFEKVFQVSASQASCRSNCRVGNASFALPMSLRYQATVRLAACLR